MTKTPDNIFLTGFMGTGKSSVGRLLSDSVGYRLIDTDEEIVRRSGKSITAIFAEQGEPAFRDMETQLLRDMVRDEIAGFVISCGGGIVLRNENVALMKKLGLIVLLTASVEEILRRTSHDRSRPLLQTPDPRRRIEELLADRSPRYLSAADITIDTTGLTPQQVVKHLIRRFDTRQSSPNP
ncbi:MAG: shikimate kinase [Candidatus Sumerlaeia bacterium]